MKRTIAVLLISLSMTMAVQAQKLKTANDTLSYVMGIYFGEMVKDNTVEPIDSKLMSKALTNYLSGKETLMTKEEAETYYNNHLKSIKQKKSMEIKEEGEKFLEANKSKDGVVTLASGLQYKVITDGEGESPTASDQVTTHYKGYSIDGKVFDSSYERGQPATFPVGGVIKGWTEALQLMKTGAKWQLFIPYNLAYGENGAGGVIKPFQALIFDVELIKINK